ncbi:MAG: PhoU domain-containing protein [Bacteroidota bacterium]
MGFFDLFTQRQPALVTESLRHMDAMLAATAQMFEAAAAHVLDGTPLPDDLEEADAVVNEHERQVRRAVMSHLALSGEAEVPLSLTIASVVQDAERIGDLAKSLAKVADLAAAPQGSPHTETLRGLSADVRALFEPVRTAFAESEQATAEAAMQTAADIRQRVEAFVAGLAKADDIQVAQALALGIAARLHFRVAAHLAAIASAVVRPFDRLREGPRGDDE